MTKLPLSIDSSHVDVRRSASALSGTRTDQFDFVGIRKIRKPLPLAKIRRDVCPFAAIGRGLPKI
ncbi:MAG: hypothetical protein ACLURV_02755 [Gallintestinimicrobium sp.]